MFFQTTLTIFGNSSTSWFESFSSTLNALTPLQHFSNPFSVYEAEDLKNNTRLCNFNKCPYFVKFKSTYTLKNFLLSSYLKNSKVLRVLLHFVIVYTSDCISSVKTKQSFIWLSKIVRSLFQLLLSHSIQIKKSLSVKKNIIFYNRVIWLN